jgi:hypothetical protein
MTPVPANVDVWQTALVKDPFKIPLEDKAELLLAINREAMKVPGIKFATASHQAIAERGEFESCDHPVAPRQAGWEYVERASHRGRRPRLVVDRRPLHEVLSVSSAYASRRPAATVRASVFKHGRRGAASPGLGQQGQPLGMRAKRRGAWRVACVGRPCRPRVARLGGRVRLRCSQDRSRSRTSPRAPRASNVETSDTIRC